MSHDDRNDDPAKGPVGGAFSRREWMTGIGLAAAAVPFTKTSAAPVSAPVPAPSVAGALPEAMLTLNFAEQAFLTAAVDHLIPGDTLSPSASACGVVTFIDRQLAGAWGGGARLYRSGPFLPGKPEHGYQLPLSPREYFAAGIVAVNAWAREVHGDAFDALPAATQEAVLHTLEKGEVTLEPAAAPFFEALLAITMEGFFADPIYGGNRDKASWRMIGYPGLPATYARAIETYRGKLYTTEPKSIGDFL